MAALTNDQLKNLLLQAQVLDSARLERIDKLAKDAAASLFDTLIEQDVLSDEQLGTLIASYLKIPFISLSKITIPNEVFHIIPERIAHRQKVIPFARDADGLKIAMADPSNQELLELLTKKTNSKITVYYATERDIHNTFRVFRKDMQRTFEDMLPKIIGGQERRRVDAPVEKIVDMLITYAYQDNASDIHIEPHEKNSLVRLRIDGILHDTLVFPKYLHDQIVSRIKVLSRLRTDEHLSPQDGKLQIKIDEENLDVRVSILPIVDGEKVVLRLLASKNKQLSLIDLGMNERDLAKITNAYNKSFGMILSTGPTGSGKTTSIYAILKILNTRDKNITTIEDPAEYKIQGVNQINVNPKTNLTFASGLRSILRQDPNIVFVGEIRDNETAAIAVNAALTGHLVLSTLHTNDAATALPRLVDMDVEPFLIASTVNVIFGQRLVRKICDVCRAAIPISREELSKNISPEMIQKHFGKEPKIQVFKGAGCKVCHGTGYAGRVGVFEVLEVTKNIRTLITTKSDADVIAQAAIEEGMTTMLDDGLDKVRKGFTTLEEVLRVTKVETL